jgi:tripeptide aminopeptidase
VNAGIDREELKCRFLSYVRIETTSDPESDNTPSSEGQWDLAKILVQELEDLGVEQVRLDEHCYVYGVLPERLASGSSRAGKVPTIGLIAHMDVSSSVSGKDVNPIVHQKYQGGPIVLPGDPDIELTPETDAPLGECVGLDIITSDGTTLLGADDKAGIAVIMSAIKTLQEDETIEHGPIHVAFTPDEEIGRGADKFDVDGFGAEVAYTVDGSGLGEIEDETFCADSMDVVFHGRNVHPGYAKNKMINSLKLAAELIDSLPKDGVSPETTDGREGYLHPMSVRGSEEQTLVKFILRDFTETGLGELARLIEDKAHTIERAHPGSRVEIELKHWYRNMKAMLDRRPEAAAFAEQAIRDVGLELKKKPIRGGTDGARLSFMGLPTPNLFAGGHNFHGKKEWIALQHMEKSVETVLRLVQIWAERGEKKGLLR